MQASLNGSAESPGPLRFFSKAVKGLQDALQDTMLPFREVVDPQLCATWATGQFPCKGILSYHADVLSFQEAETYDILEIWIIKNSPDTECLKNSTVLVGTLAGNTR